MKAIPTGIKRAAMPQWQALSAALADAGPVPCTGRDEWTSDSPEVRYWAAGHCRGCPAIRECAAFAQANSERYGVWAGRDRTQSVARPTKRKESA